MVSHSPVCRPVSFVVPHHVESVARSGEPLAVRRHSDPNGGEHGRSERGKGGGRTSRPLAHPKRLSTEDQIGRDDIRLGNSPAVIGRLPWRFLWGKVPLHHAGRSFPGPVLPSCLVLEDAAPGQSQKRVWRAFVTDAAEGPVVRKDGISLNCIMIGESLRSGAALLLQPQRQKRS